MSEARGASASRGIEVRGGATPEELAAVLALVRGRPRPVQDDPVRRWRRLRQAVTKPT